ncbi:hypothetical protein RRG08_003719 [Elysia crispata]|uniref:Uncharacterized protein n=1 Tax=Elysia crispata TaxID=231223 RepID=A0AAE1AV38_9GAST|nr:hypothetical protein RRG08_003719 [Elysia crispata]
MPTWTYGVTLDLEFPHRLQLGPRSRKNYGVKGKQRGKSGGVQSRLCILHSKAAVGSQLVFIESRRFFVARLFVQPLLVLHQ